MKKNLYIIKATISTILVLLLAYVGTNTFIAFADSFTNGVNTLAATKTAQWTANGKGDDPASKYDTLISNYSANYYQTAYIGFDLPDGFDPTLVQNATLKLTTKQLGEAITSSVYSADYNGFENGGKYEKSDNAPAFDSKVFCTDMIDYYPFEGDNIGKYKGNVLIMQGDADKTVPLKTAQEAVKHYENAELVVYEGEGHGFSAPNAQKAREKLLDFIKKE